MLPVLLLGHLLGSLVVLLALGLFVWIVGLICNWGTVDDWFLLILGRLGIGFLGLAVLVRFVCWVLIIFVRIVVLLLILGLPIGWEFVFVFVFVLGVGVFFLGLVIKANVIINIFKSLQIAPF